jgi:hypothetical protein
VKERMAELQTTVEPLQKEIAQLKVVIEDNQKELRARELSLERTTAAKDNFARDNNRLTLKLQGMPTP